MRGIAALALLPAACAAAITLDAPNVVRISDRIVTSGQPSANALARLGAEGFQAVIYLAPGNVSSAVPDEASILSRQGIEFVHIPIPFGSPNAGHFQAVTSALQRLQDTKVLVHCEINLRASSMVFLHRAITLREEPGRAYEAVTAVWSPEGSWRALIQDQLRTHAIRFEPL
jgi:protein tyrosine phosphatase (PTP) superfamily phosphohydrolase (DUF442 family)